MCVCVCVSINLIIAHRWCFPVCGTSRSLNLYFVLGNRAALNARSTTWKRIITCAKQNFWTLQKHQDFTNKRRGNKNPFRASSLMTWGYPAHQRFSGRPTGSWWSRSATAVNNHLTGLKQRPRKTTWYTYDLWQISGWAVLELTRSRIINHQPSFVSRDRVRMSEIILVCQPKILGPFLKCDSGNS